MRVIVVLGMHRSGTSLTTSLLQAMGIRLSLDLLPPSPENPVGYFESAKIMNLQDAILQVFGLKWYDIMALKPLPSDWWKQDRMASLKADLKREVAKEHQVQEPNVEPKIWGFKDPRTMRLLPLWQEIFDELHIQPEYIMPIRNPYDVARSLQARNNFTLDWSYWLWLDHYAIALQHLDEQTLCIVDYGTWLNQPQTQINRLSQRLRLPNLSHQLLKKAIVPGLQHHCATEELASRSDSIGEGLALELYKALKSADIKQAIKIGDMYEMCTSMLQELQATKIK